MKSPKPKPRRFAKYPDIPKTYREPCALYLPRPIHDDAEDAEATAMMNGLAVFTRLNAEQPDYFNVLTEFVDDFDKSKKKSGGQKSAAWTCSNICCKNTIPQQKLCFQKTQQPGIFALNFQSSG